jgi:putative ABC transport system permease protein
VYLGIQVLALPDLTPEASFGLGGACTAILMTHGVAPGFALAAGTATGGAAGLVTSLMHLRLRMNVLLASILMLSASYSIGLGIMGGTSNLTLVGDATIFDLANNIGLSPIWATIATGAVLSLIVSVLLIGFLNSTYGLSLRAAGMNIKTARGLGVKTESRQLVGLVIANGLAGLTGGAVVQNEGFADISNQTGVITVGLAALMLGLTVYRGVRVGWTVAGIVIGVIVYQFVVAWVLQQGANPNDVQLITAVVVVLAVAVRSLGLELIALPATPLARRRRDRQQRFYEEDRVSHLF